MSTPNLDPAPLSGCPVHHVSALPTDGTPLSPSPTIAAWREEAGATPLQYADGHVGWIVTRHDLAQAVLSDGRFSQHPQRLPAGFRDPVDSNDALASGLDHGAETAFRAGNLLRLDDPEHGPLRRSVTKRFSVRAVRERSDQLAEIVDEHIQRLLAGGSPANITSDFARSIATSVHCRVLGVPAQFVAKFRALFASPSTTQQKFDFVREMLEIRRREPGEDVMSDLLASDLETTEVEGLIFALMVAGHDSVAYMIATTTVALLTNPDQLEILRADSSLIPGAVEEFMRFGAMFVTLFPRTATEDVQLPGLMVQAGQTVSVSPVAANRDDRRFDHPDSFDVTRDAFGHLGFGHGPHGCIGQQLARSEIAEAIARLIGDLPNLRLISAQQSEPMPFAHPVGTYEAGDVIVAWG